MLDDARKKGLLGPHDSTLATGIEKIGDWVNGRPQRARRRAPREDADFDDAWLAVHVTGALILRLSKRL